MANDNRELGGDGDTPSEEDGDDIRSRFPDPDTDPRLDASKRERLPDVPEYTYRRPTLPEANPIGKRMQGRSDDFRSMGQAATVGLTLAFSIGIGAGFGWLVDTFLLRNVATPWGLIVGFLFGVASGFVNLVRVANKLNSDGDR